MVKIQLYSVANHGSDSDDFIILLGMEKDGDLWSMHLVQVQLILMISIAINFSGTQNTFECIQNQT